jgi:hypothetical protein
METRAGIVMRWLKVGLAVNGGVFLWRGSLDILQPTSFYLEPDAPKYAMDAIRVLGITYISLGLIQLATWWVSDRRAVRTVAGASLLFAAGVFAQAATQGSASADPFHQLSPGAAVENLLVAMLYAGFLVLDARSQRNTRATRPD